MDRPTIEDAVALAARAHRGQVDKAGQTYLLHLLRVMLQFEDEAARIVAVLHDVLEDTAVTVDVLRQAGYSEEALAALDALTRRPGESYEDFIDRAASNPLARRVKLADLADNMNRKRLDAIGDSGKTRLDRYRAARRRLQAEGGGG
jgi:(p)ppGpp synthase/HD superfamily hydrolase